MDLDLRLAWSRLVEDRQNDFFPDPLNHRDFLHRLDDQLDRIKYKLEQNRYVPTEAISYEVPKPGFFLRPATYLAVQDRVLYQAILDGIAPGIDRILSPSDVVYAFRLNEDPKSPRMFRPGVARWLQFRNDIRRAYSEEGYEYLIKTDVTAFFESIEHSRLSDQLNSFEVSREAVSMLITLLSCWSPTGRGLPQQCDPSSFLGNSFLDPLDKHIVRSGIRFFRFNDDMCVFGRSLADARRAQQFLERELRALGLFIQTKKTVLFRGDEIRQFVDEKQDEIAAIDYADNSGDVEGSLDQTKALLADVLADPTFDERHFRKCINELGRHRDDAGVDAVLARLGEMPYAADTFVRYLSLFASRSSVRSAILEFVRDGDRNLFEWQEAWLLRVLLEADEPDPDGLRWARQRADDHSSSWPIRCTAIQLLEKFGDAADIEMLKNGFRATEEAPVQRARLKACNRLPANTRNILFARAVNISDELESTVEWLS